MTGRRLLSFHSRSRLLAVGLVASIVCTAVLTFNTMQWTTLPEIDLAQEPVQSAERSKEIRVLSLNTFFPPSNIRDSSEDPRLKVLAKQIVQYDVVVLQEMFFFSGFSPGKASRMKRMMAECAAQGFKYQVLGPFPSVMSYKLFDSGLMLLSRFPISGVRTVEFTRGTHVDKLATKGALHALVHLPDGPVHIVGTHLQASYHGRIDWYGEEHYRLIRQAQVAELSAFIKATCLPLHHPILLVGDLNTDGISNVDEVMSLKAALRETVGEVDDLLWKTFGHHPRTFLHYPLCLDYAFKWGDLPVKEVRINCFRNPVPAVESLSDHCGVEIIMHRTNTTDGAAEARHLPLPVIPSVYHHKLTPFFASLLFLGYHLTLRVVGSFL